MRNDGRGMRKDGRRGMRKNGMGEEIRIEEGCERE